MYSYIYMCIYMHICIYTHTYTHTQMYINSRERNLDRITGLATESVENMTQLMQQRLHLEFVQVCA